MFQIGVAGPKRPKAKAKAKAKAKPKAKAKAKAKANRKAEVLYIIQRFKPYTGPRWQIPSGLKVSQSVQDKFRMFEQCPIDQLYSHISVYNKTPYIRIPIPYNPYIQEWKPPKCVVSAIQRHTDLRRNDFKRVRILYGHIKKFIKLFKRLLHCWRIRTCMRQIKNTVDTVTLEIPKKPVYVIDSKQRISYVYEASSIRRTIENRLLQSDYMFPEPKEPVNTLSNVPFTYGQLLSIISQCKAYGEFSWILDRFMACDCSVRIFEMRFTQELHCQAIKSFFTSRPYSPALRDTVIDFFENQAYIEGSLSDAAISKFSILFTDAAPDSYVKKWIHIAKRYHLATDLKDLPELACVQSEIRTLIRIWRTHF